MFIRYALFHSIRRGFKEGVQGPGAHTPGQKREVLEKFWFLWRIFLANILNIPCLLSAHIDTIFSSFVIFGTIAVYARIRSFFTDFRFIGSKIGKNGF